MGWEQWQRWGVPCWPQSRVPTLRASRWHPSPSRDRGWDAGAMHRGVWVCIHCSPRQSPDFLPEVGQPHASRCLQDLQKSACKDLFSSCLR